MSALPLEGVRVLDLSRVLAGPYATQVLGDLGAEIWKIERPGSGDETRTWGPPFVNGTSAYFLSINRNKRSAALDFADPVHAAALRRAAAESDVVVENFLPGDLARYGLDAASLRDRNPDLVVCSITGFGQDGPYAELPGYDAVLQGFAGWMSITGDANGPPYKVGVAVVDVLTGIHAASAILGALVGRYRGRGGAHLDVPLFEVAVASLANVSYGTLATGRPARRHGNAHPAIVPYQTFATADGALVVAVGNDEQWRRLCVALELPDLGADAELARNAERVLRREEVVDRLARRIAERGTGEWLPRLRAARVPAGPVRELHEVVRDSALETRGMIRTADRDGATERYFGLPWRTDGERPPLRTAPPRLGEHTEEFLARWG